jgi:sodium transport system ATP-binding protein
MIQVDRVTKRFAGRPAVSDLSFEAPDGRITGLLGANGAGKTTTLRMIAAALQPDQGKIHVGNASVQTSREAAQRCTGALLDHVGLYGRLSVRENIEYFGRLRGLSAKVLASNADRLLATLGLASIADRAAAELSQGERTKVALGRVLIHEPTHLLLDEPTNGLDVPTVRTLRALLRSERDAGCCIIFSSHVLGEIQALCDRVVVIASGAVVGAGSLEEISRSTGGASLEEAFLKLIDAKEHQSC